MKGVLAVKKIGLGAYCALKKNIYYFANFFKRDFIMKPCALFSKNVFKEALYLGISVKTSGFLN